MWLGTWKNVEKRMVTYQVLIILQRGLSRIVFVEERGRGVDGMERFTVGIKKGDNSGSEIAKDSESRWWREERG